MGKSKPSKAAALIELIENLEATHEYDAPQEYHVVRYSDMDQTDPPRLFSGTDAEAWDYVKAQGDADLVMINDAGIQFPLPSTDSGMSLIGQPQTFKIAPNPGKWS